MCAVNIKVPGGINNTPQLPGVSPDAQNNVQSLNLPDKVNASLAVSAEFLLNDIQMPPASARQRVDNKELLANYQKRANDLAVANKEIKTLQDIIISQEDKEKEVSSPELGTT